MATVRRLEVGDPPSARSHGEVRAVLRAVEIVGERFVQVDTYGSPDRQEVDKQSQSVRLNKAAFEQLVEFGNKNL